MRSCWNRVLTPLIVSRLACRTRWSGRETEIYCNVCEWTSQGPPAYCSVPMINRQTLFHIGMQGEAGLRHVMQILISMLGSRVHWQADILSAFQRHRLPGCALNDVKMFLRNLTKTFETYFRILGSPCSPDLATQIIRDRDRALKTACTRPGVQNNWFNRFTAAKLEAKLQCVLVHTNLPIFLQMLDYTLLEFEEAVPFLGESRSPVAGRGTRTSRWIPAACSPSRGSRSNGGATCAGYTTFKGSRRRRTQEPSASSRSAALPPSM